MTTLSDLLAAVDAAMTAIHNLHGDLGPDHDAPWHKHEAAFRKLDAALATFDPSRYVDLDDPATVERLGVLIDEHFSSGRHGLSYTACAKGIVMNLRGAPK